MEKRFFINCAKVNRMCIMKIIEYLLSQIDQLLRIMHDVLPLRCSVYYDVGVVACIPMYCNVCLMKQL